MDTLGCGLAPISMDDLELSYVLGPLGLLLMVWVWLRLRYTRYRDMAVLLLTIILLYAIAVAAMYLRGARYLVRRAPFSLRRNTILSSAADGHRSVARTLRQRPRMPGGHSARALWSKEFCYGCVCADAAGYYDPMTGISQDMYHRPFSNICVLR